MALLPKLLRRPFSKAPLFSKEKSRAAFSLLKYETNPERILDICRAAALSPDSRLDRITLSVAVQKLTSSNYLTGEYSFPTGSSCGCSFTTRDWNSRDPIIHHLPKLACGFNNHSYHRSIWSSIHEK